MHVGICCSAWLEKIQRSEENKLEESRLLEVSLLRILKFTVLLLLLLLPLPLPLLPLLPGKLECLLKYTVSES